MFNPRRALADQRTNLLGRFGASLRQSANLTCNHREPSPLLTRTRGLYRRIQSQDVGLERYAVNQTNDVSDLATAFINVFHGGHNLGHHIAALLGYFGGICSELVSRFSVVCVLPDCRAELLHGCRGFLQGASLRLGTRGKIVVALRNFTGGVIHTLCTSAYCRYSIH